VRITEQSSNGEGRVKAGETIAIPETFFLADFGMPATCRPTHHRPVNELVLKQQVYL
jgi:hypothetical protein